MATVVRMPEVATGTGEAAIQSWLVAVGDTVAAGQPLAEIETEKAVVEYEAEAGGVLAAILLPEGTAGAVGDPIAVLAEAGESAEEAVRAVGVDAAAEAAAPAAPEPETAPETDAPALPADVAAAAASESPAAASPAEPVPAPADAGGRLFASPLVRRLARERGIDLARVPGSGPRGRVVRRDLDALPAAPAAASESPTPAASAPARPAASAPTEGSGGYEDVPHTGMRRAIARRLTESKTTVPHFYLVADCRVDALLALRESVNAQGGVRISVNDLVVKAVAWAMRDVPEANAIWTETATRRFDAVDLAVAVSVDGGLLTPVVRGVDRMPVSALSATIRELAGRAREGRLKQHELEGGSFSISNLGMYGTREFSAIINPPHAGILAVGAAEPRAVVDAEGALAVANVMTVTLSADHRVLDGALAARWLAAFVARIENPVSILV
jgi:pyruvate dehydrogenase E2 component (dihydrolipoamide acetyltransferase)